MLEVRCDCAGCLQDLEPFTVPHFRAWARELTLDNGDPWDTEEFQEDMLEDLFSGLFQVVWFVVPEGNAKTTLTAGLCLYYLEHYPECRIPVAASAKEQADELYAQAEGFVIRSDRMHALKDDMVMIAKGRQPKTEVPRLECQEGFRRIKFYRGGRAQIRASDERTGDGAIPRGIAIIDELHRQRNLALYRTWRGKLLKTGAILIVISTAGEPGGEFEETRERIRQAAEVIDRDGCHLRAAAKGIVLHEWAVPEGADTEDMEIVKAANPLRWLTVDKLQAKREDPTMTHSHWRRFTCNVPTRSELAAISEIEWEEAYSDERIPVGESIDLGLDLGWKGDTTAAVPLWMRDARFRLLGDAKVLVPPRDGTQLDSDLVKRAILDIHRLNPIRRVVMDLSDARDIAEWIEDELGCDVVERGQSNKFAVRDFSLFMEALREGWLRHTGCPDLKRHALNAMQRILPQGDSRFERPHTSRGDMTRQDQRVIDALVAAAMVHTSAAAEIGFTGEPMIAVA
jgi:phage terminase large subunit-like protein